MADTDKKKAAKPAAKSTPARSDRLKKLASKKPTADTAATKKTDKKTDAKIPLKTRRSLQSFRKSSLNLV